jgi:transposase
VVSVARLVVAAVVVEGRSKSEVARCYGVSRRWVITVVQRFLAEGEAGLEPRSRRPQRSPNRVPETVEDEIVELRKYLDQAGHDSGAQTIAAHLERRHGHAPAVSTIWRVLARRGFVVPQPHKRPKSSYVRFEAAQPNERWQLDITHWALASGAGVEILNVVDDHSRLLVDSTAKVTFKADDVVACFRDATARHGLPRLAAVRQRGRVHRQLPGRWASRPRGRARLPRHQLPALPPLPPPDLREGGTPPPDDEAVAHPPDPARTLRALQAQLDTFRASYNTDRPHRALARRTPTEAFDARPKAHPTGQPVPDGHYRVRHDRIDTSGVITLRHNSKLHHIGLGRRHAGTRVLVLVHDLHVRVIDDTGQLLRQLTLDPTRDYQPQPRP